MSMELISSAPSAPTNSEITEAELREAAEHFWNLLPEAERSQISKEDYFEQNRETLLRDFEAF